MRPWGVGGPGPLRRLGRNRLAVAAAAVAALLVVVAANVGQVAKAQLQARIDENFRGAYDILVRPRGSRLNVEQTHGLVEPNFLSFTGQGGISLSQLQAIRGIAGVEVAAPVSFVGYVHYGGFGPTVFTSRLPRRPTLYRLRLEVDTSDGISTIPVQRQEAMMLLGPADLSSSGDPGFASDHDLVWGPDGVELDFRPLPDIVSPLIAVDPLAEAELLGPAGRFLTPLQRIRSPARLDVSSFDLRLLHDPLSVTRNVIEVLRQRAPSRHRPVIPIVVSRRLYAGLTLRLEIEEVGHPLASYPAGPDRESRLREARRLAGPGSATLARLRLEATRLLRPYQPASLTFLWPGSSGRTGTALTLVVPRVDAVGLMGRPVYRARRGRNGSRRLAFTVVPRGVVGPSGQPAGPEEGREQSYRVVREVPLPLAARFQPAGPSDQPFVLAPVGEFDLGRLRLPHGRLNYVPFGAYDPPSTELVAGPGGQPVAPRKMRPTLNPTGLIMVPPLAVTNIESAVRLRGPAAIDAVRVRVRGVARYSSAGVARVETVASQIAALGLDVDIVAGSSPQPVEIYAPAYKVAATPPADLGWVRQEWTTLGAAQRVDVGLGSSNVMLLALALGTAALFVAALHTMSLSARAQEVAILAAIGWRRRRVRRWILGESLVIAAVLGGLAGAGRLAFGSGWVGLGAGLGLAALFPLASVVGLSVVGRSASLGSVQAGDVWVASAGLSPRAVRGPVTYARRSLIARPARTLAVVVSLGLAAAGAGLGAGLIASALERAGPTLLAAALTQALRPYQYGLLTLSTVGAGILTIVTSRLDRLDRSPEFRILQASGWGPGLLRAEHRSERVHLALGAALLGAPVAAGMGGPVAASGPLLPAAVAVAVALSFVAWGRLAAPGPSATGG